MKTIRIELTDPRDFMRPPIEDWIAESEVATARIQARAAGFNVRIVGEVSWQEQLARMENNPE